MKGNKGFEKIIMNVSVILIVSYSFIVLVYLLSSFYFYSYYLYNKDLIFTEIKINFISAIMGVLILICFCGMGIYSSLNYNLKLVENWDIEKTNIILNIVFSWIIFSFALIHTLYAFLLPKFLNKDKISYLDINQYDFKKLLTELQSQIKFVEVEVFLKNKNPKYFSQIQKQNDYLLNIIDTDKFAYHDVMASIVCFNEEFTTKWSHKTNIYQKIILCRIIIKFLEKI